MAEQPLRALQQLLVCPACKGRLEFTPGFIRCVSCALRVSQPRNDYFDLLPRHLLVNKGNQWRERQQEMEEWYKDLIAGGAAANNCFVKDYTPYASLLATLSGNILDVGGGVGVVREYLPRDAQYTVIDPSLDWLGAEWTSLAERFPSLKTKPPFVRGIGEYLPFPDKAFDVALAFWSLNHANDPEQVFYEVYRVLQPGGRFLVVLEDMAPSWGDIANGMFPASMVAAGGGDPSMETPAHPSGQEWPLQSDHIRIRESEMQRWSSQRFELAWREWIDQYLTFEFRKIDSLQRVQRPINDTKVEQNQNYIHSLQNERSSFIQQLQAREQQLREVESGLEKERQKAQQQLQGLKRKLQAHEQQLQRLNRNLVKERQRGRRLRKRIQHLTQQLRKIQDSRTQKLLRRLGHIRDEVLGKLRR